LVLPICWHIYFEVTKNQFSHKISLEAILSD
jgi:hypothetical protein